MSALSIPPIAMAGVTFYAALYHLLVYSQRKQRRENLTFALTCFAVGLYDVFCAGLYSATSVAEGMHWQRLQVATLALISFAFLWFVADYTAQPSRKVLYPFSIYFFLAAVVGMVERRGLAWLTDQPAIKETGLSSIGLEIIYYEVTPGFLTNLQSLAGIAVFVYVFWIGVRYYRSGHRREASSLILALVFTFAGVFNDTAVSSGLYDFVYTIEYAYMGMVLLMAYTLSSSMVEADKALQDSEKKFRSIVESIPMGMHLYQLEPDGRLVFTGANPAADEILGVDSSRLVGLTIEDAFPALAETESPERYRATALRGDAWQNTQIICEEDTIAGAFDVHAFQTLPGKMVAAFLDITDRKRAEVEHERLLSLLERRSTQLQTAAEVSKSVSTILDPEELMDQTVNLIRERFDFYYVGLFLVDESGTHAVLRAGSGEAGRRMLEAGHTLEVGGPSMVGWCTAHAEPRIALDVGSEEIRFDNPFLPQIRSEMALPLLLRGQVIGALVVQSVKEAAFSENDIIALQAMAEEVAIAIENAGLYERIRQHAAQLEQRVAERTAELAAVNKELESFAYSVSHDLRAPLRGIDGFSYVLQEDYADKLDATGQDYLRRVRAASQRMGQLIDDMLKLSRVTQGEMRRERVDLSRLAQEIADELREKQPERAVEFVIEPDLDADGDARLLQVVLENLLGNAWKFTARHPRARIEFGVAERDGERPFFVRDDGAGFDMAYADHLFGAFQRLHRVTEFEGIGIGLATVQRIINRHGGRVWAEGAMEQGATFYFTLPLEREETE